MLTKEFWKQNLSGKPPRLKIQLRNLGEIRNCLQILLQGVSSQHDAWLSTWFANVFHMKDELWHISAPAAAKSLPAPDQAPPWPSLQEGPPTGRYGAHTGSRTTSAPRKNIALPTEENVTRCEWERCERYYDKGICDEEKKTEIKAKKINSLKKIQGRQTERR